MTNVLQAESRTLVENVRWETYVALSDDRPGRMPKMAFDQGRLELMSPKKEHETTKTLLGHFIIAFAEKHDLDILSVA
ncbi:MAG: Uma2 family endonuclease, partial [Planctomycetota bacterium]